MLTQVRCIRNNKRALSFLNCLLEQISGCREMIRRASVVILSLLFLSSTIFPAFCLAVGMPLPRTSQSSCLADPVESHHHEDSNCDNNEVPCPFTHHCFPLAIQNTISFLFSQNPYYFNFVETISSPLMISKSIFRPPRSHLP